MMLIIAPQQSACIVDASSYPFQPTVAALLSPPFYNANLLPLEVLKSLDSKRFLPSHLVRGHPRNTSDPNPRSYAINGTIC